LDEGFGGLDGAVGAIVLACGAGAGRADLPLEQPTAKLSAAMTTKPRTITPL
jgi:hypothetical protein